MKITSPSVWLSMTGACLAGILTYGAVSSLSAQTTGGDRRPDFELPDLDGTVRSISEWDGQVIAVNFWATWCTPCLKELPDFVELQNELGARGLQFIGIAVEPEVGPAREFAKDLGINFPNLIGELEAMDVSRALGNDIGALPFTAIIDRDGRIAFIRKGALSLEDARGAITPLL